MNNKGFTLLEMIITIGIISILMGGIAFIFPQWLRQYTMLKETAAATEIMDVVASGISEELSMSQERNWTTAGISYVNGDRISSLPLETEDCTISYQDGVLKISGQPKIYGAIFDTTFYKDMSVTLTMYEQARSRDGAKVLLATIEVYSAKDVLLSSETRTIFYYNPQ